MRREDPSAKRIHRDGSEAHASHVPSLGPTTSESGRHPMPETSNVPDGKSGNLVLSPRNDRRFRNGAVCRPALRSNRKDAPTDASKARLGERQRDRKAFVDVSLAWSTLVRRIRSSRPFDLDTMKEGCPDAARNGLLAVFPWRNDRVSVLLPFEDLGDGLESQGRSIKNGHTTIHHRTDNDLRIRYQDEKEAKIRLRWKTMHVPSSYPRYARHPKLPGSQLAPWLRMKYTEQWKLGKKQLRVILPALHSSLV